MADKVRDVARSRLRAIDEAVAQDDWGLGPGYYPVGGPVIVDHVRHKHRHCVSSGSWLGVDGSRYCNLCCPCKDPKARRS